ncbi:serine hydrolase FSH [Lipomyces arxii]|uniref:serine hydrolase FSH n=1 Tax=Lipomyces arxii TaxID=56418 RepID=UPI0034CD623D
MNKVLFLHGYTQSGTLFSKKSAALRKALIKLGFSAHYPTAPIKLSVPDSADPEERAEIQGQGIDEDSFGWWVLDNEKQDYVGLDKTFAYLADYVRTEGPFVGVVGFSQGAALAGMLCSQLSTLVPETPALKFAVLYSGFKSKLPQHQYMYTPRLTTPTLHVLGSVDTVVSEERSRWLIDACADDSRTVFTHPGGHFVPSSKDALTVVCNWVVNAVREDKKQDVEEDDWEDEFDSIGGGM